ncbi:MAG: S8 family serine peptidase [Chloroflexota bacterium]
MSNTRFGLQQNSDLSKKNPTIYYRFLYWCLPFFLASFLVSMPLENSSTASANSTGDEQITQSSTQSVRVKVVVQLHEPSVTDVYASLYAQAQHQVTAARVSAATRVQLATIEQSQQRVLSTLESFGATPIYRVQRVYNGIAIEIPAERLDEIAQLASVKAIHPLRPKWPNNSRSVPYIGAVDLWDGINVAQMNGGQETIPATGAGIKVAIIDTGIDYLHPTFGGPNTGYAENDITQVGDIPGYPNRKVIGGYDFTGDVYNSNPEDEDYQPVPIPDDDPMDCYNHGTHVSGTLAGYGVNQDRSTYQGPYNSNVNLEDFYIGPGVAPNAQIYALKVFGCTGSTDITDLAMEWSVDPNQDGDFSDRVDVINMSLGSTYGLEQDLTSLAANSAAKIGIIVVASAGNSGDTYYATGTPAVASYAISVASIRHAIPFGIAFATTSSADTLSVFSSRGPRRVDTLLKPDIAAPGHGIFSASQGTATTGSGGRAISGTSMAAPHVAGAMALLRQLYPDWTVTELKALLMNTAMPWIRSNTTIDSIPHSPTRVGSGRVDLVKATQNEVLVYNAEEPVLVSVSFGAPEVLSDYVDLKNIRMTNKSTEPVTYTMTYVPVTDVPGVEFVLPTARTLLVPAGGHDNFSVMMTVDSTELRRTRDATVSATQGITRAWLSEEAGYLLFWPNDVVFRATLTGESVAPPVDSVAEGLAIFRYNPNNRLLTYELTVANANEAGITSVQLRRGLDHTIGDVAHTLYSSTNGQLSLEDSINGTIVLTEDDQRLLLAGGLYVNVKSVNNVEGELRGQLEASRPVLNLPLYAAPYPIAQMRTVDLVAAFGGDGDMDEMDMDHANMDTGSVSLTGYALNADNDPQRTQSLVSAFELHYQSANTPAINLFHEDDPEFYQYDQADVKHVGITSDYGVGNDGTSSIGSVAQTTIYWGISTHAQWDTPKEAEIRIYIDIDEDGESDYMVYSSDERAYNSDFNVSDAFITAIENLETGTLRSHSFLNIFSASEMDTAPYHNNVMVMAVDAAAIGLTESDSTFNYYIETESNDKEGITDRVPMTSTVAPENNVLSYDVAQPGLKFYGGVDGTPMYRAAEGSAISAQLNFPAFVRADSQGLLLFHHHNAFDERIQVLPVEHQWSIPLYLPLIVNQ